MKRRIKKVPEDGKKRRSFHCSIVPERKSKAEETEGEVGRGRSMLYCRMLHAVLPLFALQ